MLPFTVQRTHASAVQHFQPHTGRGPGYAPNTHPTQL